MWTIIIWLKSFFKLKTLNLSVPVFCPSPKWPQKYVKLPWNSVIIFHTIFFCWGVKNKFFVTLLHRAGITGADVPSSKCVHRFLKKCYLFKNKYNVDIPLFLQRQLHWKWHCWVLERPYQALNPILSENYAKTKY